MIHFLEENLKHERRRFALYGVLAAMFFVLAIGFALKKPIFNFVVSDGRGYYAYLPSVIVDHDLDFRNQVQEHWDADFHPDLLIATTRTGYLPNKYPTGLSLTLAPSFLVAHVVSRQAYQITGMEAVRPDGYSVLYQLAALLTVMGLGLLTLILCDQLLTKFFHFGGAVPGLAVLTFWTGTNYSYYYFREPMMVHVVSAFWVTCIVFFGAKVFYSEKPSLKDLGIILIAMAVATVCRPTNIFVVPFVLSILVINPQKTRPLLTPSGQMVLVGASIPVLLQMLSWKILNGSWASYSYGSESFSHWNSPFLLSTLFSSRHGLFFWSPLLVLSVAGLGLHYVAAHHTKIHFSGPLTALIGGAILLWYLNSSWHQWWFGDAFGGLAFIELAPLFIFGLATFFDFFRRRAPSWTFFACALVLLAICYNYLLMGLYIGHKIPRGDYLF